MIFKMETNVLYILSLLGTAVFALSGSMAAARKELDIFGFIVVSLAPAIGGGTLRDLLLRANTIFWIEDPNYLYVTIVVAILAFFQVHRLDGKRYNLLLWADAVGLALFSVAGAQKALQLEAPVVIVIFMGVITGTFGGMLRDVICNEVPLLLQKEIYALAAIAGAVVYVIAISVGFGLNLSLLGAFLITFLVRGAALIFKWSLPVYRGTVSK